MSARRTTRPARTLVAVAAVTVLAAGTAAAVTPPAAAAPGSVTSPCDTSTDTEYAQGTAAAAIGWPGNAQAVVACLSGSFVVKNTQRTYGYGLWKAQRTTWTNAEGHLPALVTRFRTGGADVSITNFGDTVRSGGHTVVAIYSRVRVTNRTDRAVTVDPAPTAGLTALDHAANRVGAHRSVNHDYAVYSDRFGASAAYPSTRAFGSYAAHYRHMRSYWNGQLHKLARITALPDHRLVEAYRTGFEYTQITRGGDELKTGVNGYDKEYSHDVIGILATLLTQGFTRDDTTTVKALLLRLREVVGTQAQYDDGIWKYAWIWALYLQKTGDRAFVLANFATPGPKGSALQPSILDSAHKIAADRTGPGGIMENTPDIDADGYWTIDNYSGLMGLAAYRWLSKQLGKSSEYTWADRQYDSLLGAVNTTLTATITKYHLNYLPCSMVEPNTANRCKDPKDANWAAPFLFGRWAWDGYLFDAPISGPGSSLIDATYDYGFGRLKGILPANTLGGYSPTNYSTGYNAGYGEWGLASDHHRDQGILGYQFMIDHTQSGPYSWWESVAAPDPSSPWAGSHPSAGAGASPHAWGSATANLTLLDSLVAERGDGTLIVGRGVPDAWVRTGKRIAVANMPITGGRHLGIAITTRGRQVTLRLTGHRPAGPVLFQLPAFVHNLARSNHGAVDPATGTVTLSASTRSVTVTMRHRS
ncbi:hypothetical protein [uncultured Jatrophihabitans sp.]|uniref:hypothetical protein n=1 Tax=uncultured Jatrophihabitans sp. TaxID=1610747 RepID=UPI0035CB657B